MPRMRPAMRSGWKSSSASHFSPTPSSLIGLPVTARMESAAPPRPSPSTRVSTMPVMPTRSLKLLRQLHRVLAGQAVGDQQGLVRMGDVAHIHRLLHQGFVDVDAAGRVEQHHVVAAEPCRIERAPRDLLRRLPGDDRQRVDLGLLAQHAQLLLRRRPAHVERGHQHFLLVAVGRADRRSWRRSWSCRSPAGRPAGWRRAAARPDRSVGRPSPAWRPARRARS